MTSIPTRFRSASRTQGWLLGSMAAASVFGAAPAAAQGVAHPYRAYGGLSVGQSRARFDERNLASQLIAPLGGSLAITGLSSDKRNTAYRVFLGYQYNPMLALELGYFDLGRNNLQALTTPAGELNGSARIRGGALDLVGTVPMGDQFSLLARLGLQYARNRGSFSGSGALAAVNLAPRSNGTNYKAGLGLQYALTPDFLLRAEAEQYRVHDLLDGRMNVRVFSLSAVIPFGDRAPTRSPRVASYSPLAPLPYTPAPMVMAAAPPEPVAVVSPPPARMPQRVSFSAESLFGFDLATLQPDGQAALDAFARDAAATNFSGVVIEGHADRLGSSAYNDGLSLRRAEAVKAYLVGTGGMDARKIRVEGKGESMPVTQPDTCKGSQQTAVLRACLAPDRRVDVELSGTR